jgi:hypothetical protein
MAAVQYPIVIEQGATFDIELIYKDSNGDFVDLNGYSARMKIKQNIDSITSYLTLTSILQPDNTGLSMSGSVLDPKDPISGSIGIFISATTSSLLDFTEGVYDLEIESPTGYVYRLLKGNVTLSKEVTD